MAEASGCWASFRERCCYCRRAHDTREVDSGGDQVDLRHPEPQPLPSDDKVDEEVAFVALHDYKARAQVDMSFKKGQRFRIIERTNADWWLARPEDVDEEATRGYIPANYIAPALSLEAMPWYFGLMQRQECERLLKKEPRQEGRFLVRASPSRPDSYSLSVYAQSEVVHYLMTRGPDRRVSIQDGLAFASVLQLVGHYLEAPDGMVCPLGPPCEKEYVPTISSLSPELFNEWEVPRESIELGEKLGAGRFSTVFEGRWNGRIRVAVKIFNVDLGQMEGSCSDEGNGQRASSQSTTPKDFLSEVKKMTLFKDENVLKIFAICQDRSACWIVTELIPNGSLQLYLGRCRQELGLADMLFMAHGVASGMEYLESNNYIHCDLAARNVLVGDAGICKVADFGLAHFLKGDYYQIADGMHVPIPWTAPETIEHGVYTRECDVWSFGVVLYEIFTFGAMPYSGMTMQNVQYFVCTGGRLEKPEGCPDAVYRIILKCWHAEHRKRPSFADLKPELHRVSLAYQREKGGF
ncbi:tyrosine-protein kinase SRK3-like isoform X1 [Lethenteron reissneri]|uniref:tyrosine-protein kinase SRK3-like isoform X1 n=1 Tax=Lethenteron reissneri TaxID=7753 RepID=UPI002AB7623A|nr:tyrosine-protein kinase SRK3-like isoform X1 [Lethenteron reissneri]XP_061432736.1 tyrosine-protein kinase SRK3-like isoform X1 [Lethenteron reissneri]